MKKRGRPTGTAKYTETYILRIDKELKQQLKIAGSSNVRRYLQWLLNKLMPMN